MQNIFYLYQYDFLMQIEVNARRRKNWVKKLEKQPQKKVEAFLG